jgi:hypothetical protein
MVRMLRSRRNPVQVAYRLMAALVWLGSALTAAAEPPVHYHHAGVVPPGAIGRAQLQRGGPLPGYFQPVEITGPPGAMISTASGGQFDDAQPGALVAGLLIGSVYRLRVTNIPLQEGLEVFPTVEVIDRLYPPIGQEFRFPIPVELTQEELEMALAGKFVTRVIYLEDRDSAVPIARRRHEQPYFEAAEGDNPLDVADGLGRPVAILRMGGRLPDPNGPDEAFLYGCPPLVRYTPREPALMAVANDRPRRAQRARPVGALMPASRFPKRGTAR